MPELPDVAILQEFFDSTSLHQEIDSVEVRDESILKGVSRRSLQQRLKRSAFTATTRHGKHLLARFGDDRWLVFHFGMTGSLSCFKRPDESPRHTRVQIYFGNGRRLAYVSLRKLGSIGMTPSPEAFVDDNGLGPDALADDLDLSEFRERLNGRTGAIKSILMNQRIIAGIGNVYGDEVLFQAKIHPKRPVHELTDDEAKHVFRKMRRILKTAVSRGADPNRFPKSYITPRRAAGEVCPRCHGQLEATKVSGRTTYYCEACQK